MYSQEAQLNLFEDPTYLKKEYENMIHLLPTPHLDRLRAALKNPRLPKKDAFEIQEAIKKYHLWVTELNAVEGTCSEEITFQMIELLNVYKHYIDVSLIFDSQQDFLYRQREELKIDTTIIDDFLPRLIYKTMYSDLVGTQLEIGPVNHYSSTYYNNIRKVDGDNGELAVKTKSQGFAISRKLYLQSSHNPNFLQAQVIELNLAYIIGEFQSALNKNSLKTANAMAIEAKTSVMGSKYFLLCEWMDMRQPNHTNSQIDEVLSLRNARQFSNTVRKQFHSFEGRQKSRDKYIAYLQKHPFKADVFLQLIEYIRHAVRLNSTYPLDTSQSM